MVTLNVKQYAQGVNVGSAHMINYFVMLSFCYPLALKKSNWMDPINNMFLCSNYYADAALPLND